MYYYWLGKESERFFEPVNYRVIGSHIVEFEPNVTVGNNDELIINWLGTDIESIYIKRGHVVI